MNKKSRTKPQEKKKKTEPTKIERRTRCLGANNPQGHPILITRLLRSLRRERLAQKRSRVIVKEDADACSSAQLETWVGKIRWSKSIRSPWSHERYTNHKQEQNRTRERGRSGHRMRTYIHAAVARQRMRTIAAGAQARAAPTRR